MNSLHSMTGYCPAPSLGALGPVITTVMSSGLFLLGLSLQSVIHTTPLTVKFFTALPPREPKSLVGGLWYRRQFAGGRLSGVYSPHSHKLWLPFPPEDVSWSGAGSAVTFGCGLFRNRTMYTSRLIDGFAPILYYPFSGSLCPVE